MEFAAIDFETSSGHEPCAVAIVTVNNGTIIDEYLQLIQPPYNYYKTFNTEIHGLSAGDTKNSPVFSTIYPEIKKRLQGKIVVAHNESFDRSVLQKTMLRCSLNYNELQLPSKWECTMKIYKNRGFNHCSLDNLSAMHNIELNHHEALSDARACAALYAIANHSKLITTEGV